MATSSIEWTELTWNPTTGCDKVSAGCKFCYAEIMSRRLQAMGVEKYADGFKVRQHEPALAIPYGWKKPAMVFVNSMSDQCHKHDVACFFKQWGGRNKKAAGRVLEGIHHDTFPKSKKRRAIKQPA